MRSVKLAVAAIAVAACLPGVPKATAADGFDLVVLGALGGIQDGNLSAFLIHPHGDGRAVTCDAGTLVNGLRVAEEKGALAGVTVPADSNLSRVGYVLTTARYWKGPIREFNLAVEKEDEKELVAFCPLEAKKVSAKRFEWHAKDFVPKQDLSVVYYTFQGGEQ